MILKLVLRRLKSSPFLTGLTLLALTLSFTLALLLQQGLKQYQANLLQRSEGNFLIAGARESRVDLLLHTLYFRQGELPRLAQKATESLSPHAQVAPIFLAHSVQGMPLVGCDENYFSMRRLKLKLGRSFLRIGECVLGAAAAKKLNKSVDDFVFSDPVNLFDIAGGMPVRLKVVGILTAAHNADDKAIYTGLNSAWTVDGIAHAHVPETDRVDLSQEYLDLSNPELLNLHFHGEEKDFPLTAILLQPKSSRAKAELLALAKTSYGKAVKMHVLQPKLALQDYLNSLSGLDQLFIGIVALNILVLVLLLALIFIQSRRLRQSEKQLFDDWGAPRSFYLRLVLGEWIILFATSSIAAMALSTVIQPELFKVLSQLSGISS